MQRQPTQRAPDKWDSPRFLAVYNTSAGFRFQALSTLRPLAGNASRWALKQSEGLWEFHNEH
jgi:hypothetical protein